MGRNTAEVDGAWRDGATWAERGTGAQAVQVNWYDRCFPQGLRWNRERPLARS